MQYIFSPGGLRLPFRRTELLVVGSGAAAFNAAHTAKLLGTEHTLLVTEGVRMGTSRNTGSDKQTYYKLSTAAGIPDSAMEMARDLFSGGSMHGDLALTEAMGSLRGFYKLISLGVPFPHDVYGEYTGYRTDHDTKRRATSCGPLTSKLMTEALESACRSAGVEILDHTRVIELLTAGEDDARHCVGVLALSPNAVSAENPAGLLVIAAGAVIWGTGGPSAVYRNSVYPESQTSGLGAPLRTGVAGVNLTEWQYGLASLGFRWNVSGSYQQVIPRYFSTDETGGDVQEFLLDNVFPTSTDALSAVFRKGYEWPFDHTKSSSQVDIAVYREILRGRRVFMDFRTNPSPLSQELTTELVGDEAYEYLKNCGTLTGTPVERLRKMNEKAYRLYLDHGIDLEKEPLAVGVCAQHMNGGLEGDIWYESTTLPRFFPIGEANGVFGVKRPGGSALNSTQVSAQRAAERASAMVKRGWTGEVTPELLQCADRITSLLDHSSTALTREEIVAIRQSFAGRMDSCAAFVRKETELRPLLDEITETLDGFDHRYRAADLWALTELEILRDTLTVQAAVLTAIHVYIAHGGLSRGSYLIEGRSGTDTAHADLVLRTRMAENNRFTCDFAPVRPIPTTDRWFEEVYNQFETLFD